MSKGVRIYRGNTVGTYHGSVLVHLEDFATSLKRKITITSNDFFSINEQLLNGKYA